MKNINNGNFSVVVRVSYKITSVIGGGTDKEEKTKVDLDIPTYAEALDLVRNNLGGLSDELAGDIDGQILKLIK